MALVRIHTYLHTYTHTQTHKSHLQIAGHCVP
jgi:hypothetical protein